MSIQQLPMFITFYGAASVVGAIVAYILASARHRDASHWATVSFLFPPAALITLFLTPAPPEHRHARALEQRLQKHLDSD